MAAAIASLSLSTSAAKTAGVPAVGRAPSLFAIVAPDPRVTVAATAVASSVSEFE